MEPIILVHSQLAEFSSGKGACSFAGSLIVPLAVFWGIFYLLLSFIERSVPLCCLQTWQQKI